MSEKVEFKNLGIKIDRPDIKQLFVDGIRENMQTFVDEYLKINDTNADAEYFNTCKEVRDFVITDFAKFVNSTCEKSIDREDG